MHVYGKGKWNFLLQRQTSCRVRRLLNQNVEVSLWEMIRALPQTSRTAKIDDLSLEFLPGEKRP